MRTLLLLLITATSIAQTKPYPAALKACSAVQSLTLPVITPKDPADQNFLESCDSARVYYGLPYQSYSDARRCALYQLAHHPIDPKADIDSASVFRVAVLAMVYLNGQDVPRNPDLALHAVCLEEDPDGASWAEDWIAALVTRTSQSPPKPYDYCSDGPTIYKLTDLDCQSMENDLVQQKNEARLAKFMATWTPAQKTALKQFLTVFDSYDQAVVNNETEACITGTAGEQLVITSDLRQQLFDNLTAFEQGHLPAFTQADYLVADKALNETYSGIIARMDKDIGECAKPSSMIRDSERAWLRYRDAWLTFAKIRYPQIPAEAWLTVLSRQRTEWLKGSPFTNDIQP
jgi:uncharacterized protein YecT (DUF1311 family)